MSKKKISNPVRIQLLGRNGKAIRTLPQIFDADSAAAYMTTCRNGKPYRLVDAKDVESKMEKQYEKDEA